MAWSEKTKAIARAICRVQLIGGDPDQPAVRWNGTEMEPQEFPVWRDFLDEANAALNAAAAVDGDAQWNAAIEAALAELNGDMDSEMRAYAQHFAAAIRALKRG